MATTAGAHVPVATEAVQPTVLPQVDGPDNVVKEKSVVPSHPPPPPNKVDESKALAVADKTPDPKANKNYAGPTDRDIGLAHVEKEKSLSFIRAWEESEKSKVENKAQKKLSAVAAWENTKKADIEAKLKTVEEQLEKKKAEYAEKMKNKAALIHKEGEEKRAIIEARRGEERLKAEEMAAKYRATGTVPKKLIGCLGC